VYKRTLDTEIQKLANDYPVVTIIGPRQSGKTTLAKALFPDKPYVNLEAPDTREKAQLDPRAFLNQFHTGAILDEIQRAPWLLSYIQVIVDQIGKNGLFILTGSHQLELNQAITQSLAGRTALCTLLPLSLDELSQAKLHFSIDEYILKGGYPRLFKDHLEPTVFYRNYFQTYVERDLRQLIMVKDLSSFEKFVKLLAGRTAQILNHESLSNEVGVSSHTIKHWISILEASFIVTRLQPYYENFGKRLIKSPKIYFNDTGFLCYLLGIETITHLSRDPLRGNIFENLAVIECFKARLHRNLEPKLYFFRDTQGHEVDLLYEEARLLIPIEIKASSTFHGDFLGGIVYFRKIDPQKTSQGYLIYSGEEGYLKDTTLLNILQAKKAVVEKKSGD